MNLRDRLCRLVEVADPAGTVTIRWLREQLEADGDFSAPVAAQRATALEVDLTVDEVATALQRSRSAVRGWLAAGELVGYKLRGREWRITPSELRAFQDREAARDRAAREPAIAKVPNERPVDMGAWRKVDEPAQRLAPNAGRPGRSKSSLGIGGTR